MLTRKLRVGDRFGFPASTHDPKRWPAFTGTITETHANDGIVWYRDDQTGESSCFISYFRGKPEIEFNTLAYHLDDGWTCPDCGTHSPHSVRANTSESQHTPDCRHVQKGFAGAAEPVRGWASKRTR